MHPAPSTTTVPAGPPLTLGPTDTMIPSRTSTSAGRLPRWSTTVPPRIARISGEGNVDPGSEQEKQHRHPNGNAIGDLPGDDRVRPVGHLLRDFHAPVERPG